jgi:flagellar hook-associated protein 2
VQSQGSSFFPTTDIASYGVNLSSSTALAKLQVTAIKQGAENLANAVANLNKPSAYGGVNAVNSASSNSFSPASRIGAVSIDTLQLASAQVNRSVAAQAEERPMLSGLQSFAIEQDGERNLFSVNLTTADNNRSAQQKIANAINSREDLGVTASVSFNEETGLSTLTLTGRETGAENGFTVSDISGSVVSQFGLNTAATAAQDARYTVDGVSQTSDSNTIAVGGGASVTLTEVGTQTYDLYSDSSDTRAALNEMISRFNDLTSVGAYGSQSLADRLNAIYRESATDLAKVGIYSGLDGQLRVNDQLMERSIADGSLQEALGVGQRGGFLDLVSNAMNEADQNPARFTGSTNSAAGNYSALYDASYGSDFRLYAAEMNASNMGLLFDYLM